MNKMSIRKTSILLFFTAFLGLTGIQTRATLAAGLNSKDDSADSVNLQADEISNDFNQVQCVPVTSSKIRYTLIKPTGVRITVYDILAREVKTLVNEYQQAGSYEADMQSANISAGTYYYKIQTGDSTKVRKIVLTR